MAKLLKRNIGNYTEGISLIASGRNGGGDFFKYPQCSVLTHIILDINCVSNYGTFKSHSYNEYREFEYVYNIHKIHTQ
jgi:hypothetical protein